VRRDRFADPRGGLADNVTGGVAASRSRHPRIAAEAAACSREWSSAPRITCRHRRTAYRRVTPAAASARPKRRAAVAIWPSSSGGVSIGGARGPSAAVGRREDGVRLRSSRRGRLRAINANLDQIFERGRRSVVGDKTKAYQLLSAAWTDRDGHGGQRPDGTPIRRGERGGRVDRAFPCRPVPRPRSSRRPARRRRRHRAMIVGPRASLNHRSGARPRVYRVRPQDEEGGRPPPPPPPPPPPSSFAQKEQRAGRQRSVPRLHDGPPRESDDRQQEASSALASGRHLRQGHDTPDPVWPVQLGGRCRRNRDVPQAAEHRAYQHVHRRPVRKDIMRRGGYIARPRRERLPLERSAGADVAATCRRSPIC